MRKLLAATALVACIGASAEADVTWRNDGHWQVWSTYVPGNHDQECFAKITVPTVAGGATIGLSQNDTRSNLMVLYTEAGLAWRQSGKVTFQVDNNAPRYVQMTADPSMPGALAAVLNGDGQAVRSFVAEVMTGQTMTVTTLAGTRVVPLAGSQAALTDLGNCVDRINAQRVAPSAPLSPALPATPPAPRLPKPIPPRFV